MQISDNPHFDAHAQVSYFYEAETGLRAIIAVHRFSKFPALGGCRMVKYAAEADALSDALRLSRAMSYKAAMAGYPFVGGKSVILGDPDKDKSPALLKAMARCIDRLQGRYVTGEDMGITMADVSEMKRYTPHLVGTDSGGEEALGVTAEGVFQGIRATVAHRLRKETLGGVRVAIQGIGKVGYRLAEKLVAEGAQVIVSDVRTTPLEAARTSLGVKVVEPEAIYDVDADVFAPCAFGATVNGQTVGRLKVSCVAGAANNQLEHAGLASDLQARGILYAPDYVINAGGMMNVAEELIGYDKARLDIRIAGIFDTLRDIYAGSEQQGMTTLATADSIAEERIQKRTWEEE